MRLRWTLLAASHLEHIANYLQEHRPSLAALTVHRSRDASTGHKTPPGRRY